MVKMLIFMIFITISPDFSAIYTFYMTDYLKFTTEDLANFSAFGSFCYVIGLLFYYYCMLGIKPVKLYKVTTILNWLINCSFLLVLFGVIQRWGFDVKLFCMLSVGATSLVLQINFMPIMAVWIGICPDNLEGLSVTLITGVFDLAANSSSYFGGFILWLLDFNKKDYSKTWIPAVIENSYLLLVICSICCLEFPDPNGKVKIGLI